jgi:uncharacterized zinc-type alcohol dehydrogenase-like protein
MILSLNKGLIMTVEAYAVYHQGEQLRKFKYELEPLCPWEIEVTVTHCGICHSDIHLIDNDWEISSYPLVPGHEIIGTVTAKGKSVDVLKLGDRVGIGWQCGSCFVCEHCTGGRENICHKAKATCVDQYGGFATAVRADSRFAFRIPDALQSETTAPLLCGGITVYSPLRIYGVTAPMKVGIIGIGGLGHLAVQFAHKFGCEVTAFTSSPEKEAEIRQFGSHSVILNTDHKALLKEKGSYDFILSTVFTDMNWDLYMNLLKRGGKLCFVGALANPISISPHHLTFGKVLCGSNIGSRRMISEMLEFAARHNISAKTEVLPMAEVNMGIKKIRANKARYRIVLINT